jgi:hypothetical protein
VRVALGCGLAAIAVAVAATLSRAPLVVAGTNAIPAKTIVAATKGGVSSCQNGEVLPRGTTAVRLWMTGNTKPGVHVEALSGLQVVTSGSQGGGWLGKVITVPVARVPRTIRDVQLCFTIDRAVEVVDLLGGPVRHAAHGESTGKMRIEYLRPDPRSWWSLAGSVAHRFGLGRAPAGGEVFLIPLALMALVAVLAAWIALRQLGLGASAAVEAALDPAPASDRPPTPRGAPLRNRLAVPRNRLAVLRGRLAVPRGVSIPAHPPILARLKFLRRAPGPAWACACVAFLSAASWSIVTPPFQVTDEPSHFAYTQILAETGSLPKSHSTAFSAVEAIAIRDLNLRNVRFNQTLGTISTTAEQQRLQHDLALPLSRVGRGAAVAAPQPPLYYALQTIPYELASSGTLLDQLALMRLLSALMAAFTALFAYLFLKEALPAVPWAWTVGGLCTALAPLVGFISGAVNPDSMLCAVSAALFYTLARAFRHGLTPRTATAIGAATATGSLTKLNFIGLAPGILLALLLLTHQATKTSKHTAHRSLTIALTISATPAIAYILINLLSHHQALGLASTGARLTSGHRGSLLDEASYIWQSYLPRLPGMRDYFPGISTIRQLWFDRSVGLYGWLDTYFPGWVYNLALVAAGAIAALCARELLRTRTALRARAGELLAYATTGAGLLLLIGADSYLEYPNIAGAYSEPRYLLPMAALFAAVLALAARGAGRRWGPAVGTLLVLLILAHDIFSQLLEVGRFYA